MKQGEELTLRIEGAEGFDLDAIDFAVYVYCSGFPDIRHKKAKTDCTREVEDGVVTYLCTYSPEETAAFAPGMYSLEIRDITNGCVYVKDRRFVVNHSATAIDIKTPNA